MNGLRADSLYVSIYRAKMKLTITYTGVVSQRIEIEIHTLDRKVEIHCYMNQTSNQVKSSLSTFNYQKAI